LEQPARLAIDERQPLAKTPMNKNDEYRANAAECERMAHFTRNGSEKRTWLEMAESWLRLIQPLPPPNVDRLDAIEPGGTSELRSRTEH
jgi:hypothetical protein